MTSATRTGSRRAHSMLFVRGFLVDYARNRVNLIVLVLVPVVFVMVASGPLADFSRLLGGEGPSVESVTSGWAAGFLAGIAMYFQTRAARTADRRLVLAGLSPLRLVAARLTTGILLALFVSAAAVLALTVRTGVAAPGRVLFGTLMFALIYVAIGAVVGALLRDPVNGTVLILFIWIIDVFFGPAFVSPEEITARWLPTHFVTLWMVDLPSRHGGQLDDLGWALAWTTGGILVSALVVTKTTRTMHPSGTERSPGSFQQLKTAVRMGLRAIGRNVVLWALLVAIPVVFIVFAWATTPKQFMTLTLIDGGQQTSQTFWLPEIHAGTMTPIAVASLSALIGLFVVLDTRIGDQRLSLAGFRRLTLLAARLTVIAVAVVLVAGVSLLVTATVFDAEQPLVYAAGNVVLAFTYGLVGVCLGPALGRVSGVLVAFLVPFLDVGISQSPMLRPEPGLWARALPSYGSNRVILDGGLTRHFDEFASAALALVWIVVLLLTAAWIFRRSPGR
ncbi:ABC transporter permease [Hoyosella altamirensis]|uniref:ABC-2 type transporter transmembrane domain-containing protein n=1 Tax=Hoyosella altamirensis TaxID=616997 RepID=A0A839RKF2_9ACTN|nr:ABC transporter permease [Hoyosella altamirensis]MBB3037145.1 hypothetical protein [Hoyosella altamirensis]